MTIPLPGYNLAQAQRDIAGLRGVVAHLQSAINAAAPIVLAPTAAPQTISATSPDTPVTGMSCQVGAATYCFYGIVHITNGTVAARQAVQLSGPTVSSLRQYVNFTQESTGGESVIANSGTSYGHVSPSGTLAISSQWQVAIGGIVTFSAGGTFGVTATCITSASDHFTVDAGSFLIVQPVIA